MQVPPRLNMGFKEEWRVAGPADPEQPEEIQDRRLYVSRGNNRYIHFYAVIYNSRDLIVTDVVSLTALPWASCFSVAP